MAGEPARTQTEETAKQDQFAEMVARHSRFLFRFALSLVRNHHDAEDVVQEAFLKVYRSGTWTQLTNEKAFLGKVAWRLAVDKLRKNCQSTNLDSSWIAAGPSGNPSVEEHSTLHRLIDSLPEELRQPLVLSALEELTSKEIGEVLGCSDGTVRTRIMRARKILREKLASLEGGTR